MSTGDLTWSRIRSLRGTRQAGFEELCVQLARAETPDGATFYRKGSPDAGVECFCVLADGSEWGWQAKFFTASPEDAQWGQLDKSVRTALNKHPRLARYFVCIPVDRPDARREDQTSALQKWNNLVAKWEGWAADGGMSVEFDWWGASELVSRLSEHDHAGRVAFWFGDHRRFNDAWFVDRLDEALTTAGERYTPEVHIDLSIAGTLDLFGRGDSLVSMIHAVREEVGREFAAINPSRPDSDGVVREFGLGELRLVGRRVLAGLDELEVVPDRSVQIAPLVQDLDEAVRLADEAVEVLERLEGEHDRELESRGESTDYRPDPFGDWRVRLLVFQREIRRARGALEDAERYSDGDLLILQGAAGTGKTHLLCDFARGRSQAGQPTVMLMGQQFRSLQNPWRQSLELLDLSDLSTEEFVGALEAAAEAADSRALVIVDALNEGRGLDIWPGHLPAFLHRLRQSPWIGVVLSVRSTYTDQLIPDHVQQGAVVVEHYGFQGNEYEAARAYFDHYGLEFPSTPVLYPEFSNPLFLKTICRGLQGTGRRRLPRGFQGISALFNLYLEAVHCSVSHRIDYDRRDNLVREALRQLAVRILEVGPWALTRRDAKEIVDSVLPNRQYSKSLFEALTSEGVLLQDMVSGESEPAREFVYMSYERFADHVMADHLLTAHLDPQDPAAAFNETGGLAFLAADNRWSGLVEALSVQVPERCGQELLQVAPHLGDAPNIDQAFLQSIVWRDRGAFPDATFAMVDDLLTEGERLTGLYDTLLTVAVVPGHPFNAETLDRHLRRSAMPDRDASWSTYLHDAYGARGPADRLLDWSTSLQRSDQRVLEDEVADLSAIALGWMLTCPNRFIRDRATKGLVTLLTSRIAGAEKLIRRFHQVDDPYIRERVYAVAYGVAMRSHDPESLGSLASLVYELVFAAGEPPPHILLRDYARGVIERAIHLKADITMDARLFRPPYRSVWPHIPDEGALQPLVPHYDEKSKWELLAPERSRNLIKASVMNSDFAWYVIGTNHGRNNWLSLTLNETEWQSPSQRLKTFENSVSTEALRALEELQAAEPRARLMRFASEIVGVDHAADKYGRARQQAETARGRLLSALNSAQMQGYEAIRRARADGDPTFDLSVIQRYVLWRVFDLGWKPDRFGRFDAWINQRHPGRHTRKPERFGKKYQWIAYHEILAHMSDRYQYRDRFETDPPDHRYRGPWQIHRRDIDPSWTHPELPAESRRGDANAAWWAPNYADWRNPRDHGQWLRTQTDLPNLDSLLRRARDSDGINWVNLRTLPTWTEPAPFDTSRHQIDRREFWFRATAYFVDTEKAGDFLRWSDNIDFWNRWMPEPPENHALYIGEHGWGPAFAHTVGTASGLVTPTAGDGTTSPIPVRIAAFEYHTSGGEYDCSVENGQTLYVLHPTAIDAMGLKWQGHAADYVDDKGNTAVFDPTAHKAGPPALLIREDLLANYLQHQRLALVWAVTAEKRIIPGRQGRLYDPSSWSGSCQYTRQSIEGEIRSRGVSTDAK